AGRKAERLLADAAEAEPAALRSRILEADCWIVCRHDAAYPPALRDAGDAPSALVGRGDPAGLKRLRQPGSTVTVVGARRATSPGREIARALARELAGA